MAGLETQRAVVGLQMDRDVVHLHADAGGAHGVIDLAAGLAGVLGADADHVEMPGALVDEIDQRARHRQLGEQRVVARDQFAAPVEELLQSAQLADAERGLKIGQAVIQSERDLFVIPAAFILAREQVLVLGHAVSPQQGHPLGQRRVARGGEAALGRRHDLDRMEAEDRDVGPAAGADRLAAVGRADAVRRILDHAEAVVLGQRPARFLVGRAAAEMHRDDGLGQAAGRLRLA